MRDHEKSDAPEAIDEAALDGVSGAFNPQPDPPGKYRPISANPVIQPINVNAASRPGG